MIDDLKELIENLEDEKEYKILEMIEAMIKGHIENKE